MFGWFKKINEEKPSWEHPTEPHLLIDHKQLKMTQSQVEKVLTAGFNVRILVDEGFQIKESSPVRITAVMEKENYFCEYSVTYELDGNKVKKVVTELQGQWSAGKKTGKLSGGTNDPFDKWRDWDCRYEDIMENLRDE